MTTIRGHMTNYRGRHVFSVRHTRSDSVAHRAAAAGGKLSPRARKAPRSETFFHPEGACGPRARWARVRSLPRAHASVPAGAAVLRSPGARRVPRPARPPGGGTRRADSSDAPTAQEDRETSLKITAASTLERVAAAVGEALRRAEIRAVLTGGACAVIYSGGEYQSEDVDLILESATSQRVLDEALARVGFKRKGDRYVHPLSRFFVEFPRGPISVGRDVRIVPVPLRVGGLRLLALSATDSCRDRLAAFYHWNDRQSLETAVSIALNRKVDLAKIRSWSAAEGSARKFEDFARELKARKRSPFLKKRTK